MTALLQPLRRSGSAALQLGLQMPLLIFLSVWSRYANGPAAERAGGLELSLCFAALFAFVYLMNKTTDAVEDAVNVPSDSVSSASARGLRAVAWLCLIVPAARLGTGLHWAALGLHLSIAFWGYAYSRAIPLIGLTRRLKDLFLIKTIVVAALGWAPAIVYAPMAFSGKLAPGHLQAYLRLAALIFAISACCDIRDLRGDRVAGVRTLPVVLGIPATKALCLFLVAIYAITEPAALVTMDRRFAEAVTVAWIAFSGENRSRDYYHWGFGVWILALLWRLWRAS